MRLPPLLLAAVELDPLVLDEPVPLVADALDPLDVEPPDPELDVESLDAVCVVDPICVYVTALVALWPVPPCEVEGSAGRQPARAVATHKPVQGAMLRMASERSFRRDTAARNRLKRAPRVWLWGSAGKRGLASSRSERKRETWVQGDGD